MRSLERQNHYEVAPDSGDDPLPPGRFQGEFRYDSATTATPTASYRPWDPRSLSSKFKFASFKSWLTRSGILLGTAVTAATVGSVLAVTVPMPGAISPKEGQKLLGNLVKNGFQYQVSRPVTVLVMGIDRVPEANGKEEIFSGRSDTMLLLRVDPKEQSVNMLSIPRDTQTEVPGVGLTKINQANASGGPLLARETVSKMLNGVEIDRYVRVSTEAFRELVDLLGGVRIYVPKAMQYEDKTQKLKIDLQPGWQTLNGEQAEQFARFRQDDFGDIGRVQRQQALLKALREQVSNPLMIARMPSVVRSMQQYIDTNLTFEEILALVNLGLKLEPKNFNMVLLPGRFSGKDEFRASYWVMDPARKDQIMQEYFQQSPTSAELDDRQTEAIASDKPQLRIALQNAADDPEAANHLADYLATQGYNSLFITEPWTEAQKQTQVIVQSGQLKEAKALQKNLNIGVLESTSTGDIESDVTIRVGNDWRSLKIK